MVRAKLPHLSVKFHRNFDKTRNKNRESKSHKELSVTPPTSESSADIRPSILLPKEAMNSFKKLNKSVSATSTGEKSMIAASIISTATTAVTSNNQQLTEDIRNIESSLEYISLFSVLPSDSYILKCNSFTSESTSPTTVTSTSSSISPYHTFESPEDSSIFKISSPKQKIQYSLLLYKKQLEMRADYACDVFLKNILKLSSNNDFQECWQEISEIKFSDLNELYSKYNQIIVKKNYRHVLAFTKGLLASLHLSSTQQDEAKLSQILHNVSVIHTWSYNFTLAMDCIQECLFIKRSFQEFQIDFVLSLCELGLLQYSLAQYDAALQTYREALHYYTAAHTSSSELLPRILNSIAAVHYQLCNYSNCKDALDEVYYILSNNIRKDNERSFDLMCQISFVQCNLAYIHQNQEMGISYLEEALMIQECLFDCNHFIVNCTMYHLDFMTNAQLDKSQKLREDSKLQSEVCIISKLLFSQEELPYEHYYFNDLQTCIQLGPLASIDEYSASQRVHDTLFKTFQAFKLETNPISLDKCDIQQAELKLSNINATVTECLLAGRINQALDILKQIQSNLEGKYGKDHHLIGTNLHNIGTVHFLSRSKYSKAMKYFQNSLKARVCTLGNNHSTVLATLVQVGMVYMAMEKFDPAFSTFNLVLSRQRKYLGYNHPSVAITLNNIACIHYQNGGLLPALKTLEEAIEILRQHEVCGEDTSSSYVNLLSIVLMNYGFLKVKRKEFDDGIISLEESLRLQREERLNDFNALYCDRFANQTVDNLAYAMALSSLSQNDCIDALSGDIISKHVTIYREMLE